MTAFAYSDIPLFLSPVTSGDLVLDAENNPAAVFIFRTPGSLSTTQNMKVILANGANPNNIYWSAGNAATFAQHSIIEGNIFADTGITYAAGCTHHGRYDSGCECLSHTVPTKSQWGPEIVLDEADLFAFVQIVCNGY